MEHATEHVGNLFLAGVAVAGDGHLYLRGGVLGDGHLPLDSCCDGYALCPTELEHALYVFAEERSLDSHTVGQIAFDDAAHSLVDVAELEVWVGELPQVDDTKSEHRRLLAFDAQHAIAHDVGSRVDAQDDLLRHKSAIDAFRVQNYEIIVKNMPKA